MPTTVVLIDDDTDDIEIMHEALTQFDPKLICLPFMDSREALHVVTNELIIFPNYIFIDINMPMLTGDKCLKEFRKQAHLRDVVIIMLSTSMPPDVAASLKEDGANYTFQKPSKFEDYQTMLRKIFQNLP